MTTIELLAKMNPADSVLEKEYESLNVNQKRFADKLMGERYYNSYYSIKEAIEMASKVQKWSFGEPRSAKLDELFTDIEKSSIIELKNLVKQYRSLTHEEQVYVYNLVVDAKYDLEEALKLAKTNIVFIGRIQIPGKEYIRRNPKEGEGWLHEALNEIGNKMMDKNIYSGIFLDGYYRYTKSRYISKEGYLKLIRLQRASISGEIVTIDAMDETSIEIYSDPDDEYNYQYIYLNKYNYWHCIPDWKFVGNEKELFKKDVLKYEDMKIREMERWLEAAEAVDDE